MNGRLTVVSCGVGPEDLTPRHREAVRKADVLAGGSRLLEWFPEFAGERRVIGPHVNDTVDRLIRTAAVRHVVVLASGDALFFGIARLFFDRIPREKLVILPNITAAQAALARLHLPWRRAAFFSVHGRDAVLPWRRVLRAPVAVVYCDGQRTPASVSAGLVEAYPPSADRPAAIAADLGTPHEDVQTGTLSSLARAACAGMSMLILAEPRDAARIPPLPLGLADDAYNHEAGLITHPEVRAVVLSKLRLRPGVFWDLGAGSGSVSLEAAGLCAGVRVCAVERQASRCEQIRANAAAAGLAEYEVFPGEILSILPDLPRPDAVFVGGGGEEIADIVAAAFAALQPGGTLVAAAVLEESRARLLAALPGEGRESCRVSVSRAGRLGTGTVMRPGNPVTLFTFRKEPS